MPSTVYIKGRAYRLSPTDVIGQGGEATIFKLDPRTALKVYRDSSDPAYTGKPHDQAAARARLNEHQRKLPAFPKGLPAQVVAPVDLAFTAAVNGMVAGYTMPFLDGMEVLLSYGDRKYREQGGIDSNQVVTIFRNSLHPLVRGIHARQVVIGDFNDLNVLVDGDGVAFLVDADSMQYKSFLCHAFTARFVDPLHCDPTKLVLVKPHSQLTDWYAFTTMFFQSILFINPYGGVHRPKTGKSVLDSARVLQRISVFSPGVIYPKAALPLGCLSDDLAEFFQKVFEKDWRGEFPLSLLESLRWTTCSTCRTTHARGVCPTCAAPGVVKQKITIRGTVTATRIFQTSGQILFTAVQGGKLLYVYHESGVYRRENSVKVLDGALDRDLRIRIWGDNTLFAKGTSLVVMGPTGVHSRQTTELVGRLPVFDANGDHMYWLENNQLVRDGSLGSVRIGDVLANQTLIWVGDSFGFGFYRAGSLTRGFVFDAKRQGINDQVPLPPITGNLIDASCTFASHTAWFMVVVEDAGVVKHRCFVVNKGGQLMATTEATAGDGTWLGDGIRGHLAVGQHLYAATDSGLIRVGISSNSVQVNQEYPDTEPFVSTATQLFAARDGIVAVSPSEIVLLQIK